MISEIPFDSKQNNIIKQRLKVKKKTLKARYV